MNHIKKIIKKPLISDLSTSEKTLLYRYRYALKDEKEYLIYFLNSIDWKIE
jgi:superoxide dismutase